MQKIRHQGSVIGGIILLILGGLFVIGLIVLIVTMPKSSPEPVISNSDDAWIINDVLGNNSSKGLKNAMYIVPMIMLIIGIILFFSLGTWLLVNGLKGTKVKQSGHKTICTVEDYRVSWSRHGGRHYHIDFAYKGESGEKHILNINCSVYRFEKMEKGMKFECYILNEDCYLDLSNIKEVTSSLEENKEIA